MGPAETAPAPVGSFSPPRLVPRRETASSEGNPRYGGAIGHTTAATTTTTNKQRPRAPWRTRRQSQVVRSGGFCHSRCVLCVFGRSQAAHSRFSGGPHCLLLKRDARLQTLDTPPGGWQVCLVPVLFTSQAAWLSSASGRPQICHIAPGCFKLSPNLTGASLRQRRHAFVLPLRSSPTQDQWRRRALQRQIYACHLHDR